MRNIDLVANMRFKEPKQGDLERFLNQSKAVEDALRPVLGDQIRNLQFHTKRVSDGIATFVTKMMEEDTVQERMNSPFSAAISSDYIVINGIFAKDRSGKLINTSVF
jgi:hypothetical protein